MLKASTLYIVLIISLILGVLCTTLLLAGSYYRFALIDYSIKKKLVRNVESGIKILLSKNAPSQGATVLDLFGEGEDSVVLKSKPWGILSVASVKAFHRNQQYSKSLLYGYKLTGTSASALYLTDNNRALSVCGNALLRGTCYLPEAGVERSYIAGAAFNRANLVEGTILKSTHTLPALDQEALAAIGSFQKGAAGIKKIPFEDFESGKPLLNSFADTTILLYSSYPIFLSTSLKGNIIVQSEQAVNIQASAVLNDILVFAPSINVSANFSGTVQLFATDSIEIGAHAHLNYPSMVVLLQGGNQAIHRFIHVKGYAQVKGQLFALQSGQAKSDVVVVIDPHALVEGQVYSEGFVNIRGTVWGNITSNKLIVSVSGGIYQNQLLDGQIDFTRLHTCFSGSALLPCEKKKQLIQWVQ